MRIRAEVQKDICAVRALNRTAFGTDVEANLVDTLRQQAKGYISLVAEHDGLIVGHIFFSPVTLTTHESLKIMGLGPMAVEPSKQKQGIGSALVRVGLDECKRIGTAAVIVLGHAEYYPRFGFSPAAPLGISSEFDVPDEFFMVLELQPGTLKDKSGIIRYHSAFSET